MLKLNVMKWGEVVNDSICRKCRAPIHKNQTFTFIEVQSEVGSAPGDFCRDCGNKLWGLRRMRNFNESIFCAGLLTTIDRFNKSLETHA